MIEAKHISVVQAGKTILHPASLRVSTGEFIVILGPNGAGKSTLLQTLAGNKDRFQGELFVRGENMRTTSPEKLAKIRAYMHQHTPANIEFTVKEVLELGRMPYHFGSISSWEIQLIQRIMKQLELEPLADRVLQTLSGGEQQRVQFARNLIQLFNPNSDDLRGKILFMDEPLNNLDMKHQLHLLQIAKEMVQKAGGTVITVLHDLNVAYQFADRVWILKNGHVVIDESVESAFETERLSQLFEVQIKALTLDKGGVFFHISTLTEDFLTTHLRKPHHVEIKYEK